MNRPEELRPCRLAPAGWRCTRGGGHAGPCAAVRSLYPGGPEVGPSKGIPTSWATPPGSQVAPSMGLPSKTPEEHDRDTLRHLDGAQWVRLESLDGKVTWLPATPEDRALLDAFRAARNGPREVRPGGFYKTNEEANEAAKRFVFMGDSIAEGVARAPRAKWRTVLERAVALIQNLIGKSS